MISDDELLAAIDAAEQQALGTLQGEVASDRADAIDRYLGKEYGDEQAGRSRVVSRDVSDVVEGVLANVLKPFVGGDQVVQFDPRGPEDVEAAQQETDYINFIALERNPGFIVLNSAVKDALLLRAGYVKCGWTKRSDIVTETYQGLSEEEVAMLVQDKEVEVVQHSEYPDPNSPQGEVGLAPPQGGMGVGPALPSAALAGGMPASLLHDIKVRRAKPTEYVEILPVPPDEMLVGQRVRTPSLQEADFLQHRTHMTLSDLRQMGYEIPDDIGDDEDGESLEEFARQRFGTRGDLWDDETQDPARRRVLFKENYIRIDRDGDGVAELRKVCQVGRNILRYQGGGLADEEADIVPFACFSSVLMPHQHLGLSVYDLIKDLAQIKTALMRSYLDNRYLQNNGRSIVDVNRVNLDDLLVSRPGGVVRVDGDPTTAVLPLVTPDTGAGALQGLEYLDSVRENRTGYTRYAQGMDSDSLINKTATGLMQAQSQSQMRLEMISRTIAETGIRDMFRIVHALTLKHSTRAEKVRLRNRWVEVNPREWARRTDLSISVGLGSASPSMQMQNLMMLGQAQEKAMMLGLVKPSNVYNLLKKITNAAGFKSPEEFFSEPAKDPQTGEDAPPPQQKDPLVQAEEVKGQFGLQKAQMDGQVKGQEMEHKGAIEERKMMIEAQLERERMAMEFEFKRWEAQLKAEVQRDTAMVSVQGEAQKAQIAGESETKKAQIVAEGSETQKAEKQQAKQATAEMQQLLSMIHQAVAEMKELSEAPKEIVRGPDGRAAGVKVGNRVRNIQRGPDGRATGLQ